MSPDPHKIQVGVRIRPLTPVELALGQTCSWAVRGQTIQQVADPDARPSASLKKRAEFKFQYVFGPETGTGQVFDVLVAPIVRDGLAGVNGAVCCYGQTSAGKTYTCQGTEQDPGIIRLALRSLFASIRQDAARRYQVRCSYIEIYNEHVFDLLSDVEENLVVQEDKEKVTIKGLIEEIVTNEERALDLIATGLSKRKVAQTIMNEHSSRSHFIFRVSIDIDVVEGNGEEAVKRLTSQLNFVDLAGSERISRSAVNGVSFKEGTLINKSLLSLGTVISSLSRGLSHAPFRDSRLTLILKNCLGGNSRTAFIQCITPARSCIEESISTFRLAYRIGNVTTSVQVNEVATDPGTADPFRERYQKLQAEHQQTVQDGNDLRRQNRLLQIQLHQYKTLYMRTQEKNSGQRASEQADRQVPFFRQVFRFQEQKNQLIATFCRFPARLGCCLSDRCLQEAEQKLQQLNEDLESLRHQMEFLDRSRSTLETRNRDLEQRLEWAQTEIDDLRDSARLLDDLLEPDTSRPRLERYPDLGALESDLYSALRTVISYRSQFQS